MPAAHSIALSQSDMNQGQLRLPFFIVDRLRISVFRIPSLASKHLLFDAQTHRRYGRR
jgi:hypothetical protein